MPLSEMFEQTPAQLRTGLPADVAPTAAEYAAYLISRRRSESTTRSHATCFRTIVKTAVGLDVCPYPMTPGGAISIFAQFAYEKRSYKTIAALRTTLSQMHESGSYPDPTKDRSFSHIWQGIRREVGTGSPNRKIALYRDEVGEMIAIALAAGRRELATMIAVNFEGALRSQELFNLEPRDVVRGRGGMSLNVRKSKTDQTSKGALVALRSIEGASFDAPGMLDAWLAERGSAPGPIFTTKIGGRRHRHRAYSRTLKGLASIVGPKHGFSASDVSTHSLRAGYVTTEIDRARELANQKGDQRAVHTQTIAEIAAHLRHSSLELLLVYYRPRSERPNFVANAVSVRSA